MGSQKESASSTPTIAKSAMFAGMGDYLAVVCSGGTNPETDAAGAFDE